MNFNPKQILGLAGLFIVVVVSVIPLGRTASSLSDAHANLQSAKFRANKIQASHQSLSDQLIPTQTTLHDLTASIWSQMPTGLTTQANVQNTLRDCARDAGGQIDSLRSVNLNGTDPRSENEDTYASQLNTVSFEMRWRGSEAQFKTCLKDLIKVGPALQIETLDLNQPYGPDSPLTVTMRVTVLLRNDTKS